MTSSPPPTITDLAPPSTVESQLSLLIYDISQQVQGAMNNMLKLSNEIDQNSAGITEDIEKTKESALQRQITLDEEKDQFQKATFAVFDMLNSHGNN